MLLLVMSWLLLHGPDGQPILLNQDQIVSVRPPRAKEHFAPGTQCLINTTDGKVVTVQEDCWKLSGQIRPWTAPTKQ